jgi:hypothetical protein
VPLLHAGERLARYPAAMLHREWISIDDPANAYERYVFDVSFLLSSYECIYGAGCPGAQQSATPETGCCTVGAHYVDEDDETRTEAMVDTLGPEWFQNYPEAIRGGITAQEPSGDRRTRVRRGACIFLNRANFHTGAGCALHHYAMARGEHHMTYKPEVCWIVPLRREIVEDVADDGETLWITTITSYDRGAWGPGGSEFDWWCTESAQAYVAAKPVYRSMEHELRAMVGDAAYAELASYLDDRRTRARTPLPMAPTAR